MAGIRRFLTRGRTAGGVVTLVCVMLVLSPIAGAVWVTGATATTAPDATTVTAAQTTVNVSGQVLEPDGSPAAHDHVEVRGVEGTEDYDGDRTDGEGRFTATVIEGTYAVEYEQDDPQTSGYEYPTDGVPDVYALGELQAPDDLGTVTLPTAQTLNVTVEDASGNPVENASVHIRSFDNGAEANLPLARTDADGRMVFNGSDGPGVEVVGDVAVGVQAPPDSNLGDAYRELTVTDARTITITLKEVVAVTGQVVEADGTPAVNDTVGLRGLDGTESDDRTVTDSQGSFEASVAKGGHYGVVYRQDDPRRESDTAFPTDGSPDVYAIGEVDATSDLDLGTVELPSAHELEVTVVDPAGNPIEGATVHVVHRSGDVFAHVQGPSNANGRLEVPGSDGTGVEVVGDVIVEVEPPDGSSLGGNGTEITVTESRSLTLTLHEEVTVSGVLNESDGTPAANDLIAWHGLDVDDGAHNVTSDTGRFRVSIRPGTYETVYRQDDPRSTDDVAFPDDGTPDVYAFGELRATADTQVSDTLPEAYDLDVQVVDPSGTPIEGATVHVAHRNGDAIAHVQAPTNTDGLVEHPQSDGPGFEVTGQVRVHVEPPDGTDFGDNGTELTVTGPRNVTLTLQEQVTVTGRLNESDGTPAANDLMAWHGIDVEDGDENVTTETGRFRASLQPGTYEVFYRQDDPRSTDDVAFPDDGSPDVYSFGLVDIQSDLHASRTLPEAFDLSVRVVDSSGTPIEGATVHVAHLVDEVPAHVEAPTNADGLVEHPQSDGPGFEVTGDVVVHVEPPSGTDYGENGTRLTVTENRTVRLVLQGTAPVSGQLVEPDGTPLANATVHVHGRNGTDHNDQAITDAEGRFAASVPANGTYNVHVHQDDFTDDTDLRFPDDAAPDIYGIAHIDVGPSGVDLGTVNLPSAHDVQVEVVEPDGTPVPNATVRVFHNPPFGAAGGPDANLLPHGAPTNAEGLLEVPGSDGPGLDLVGDIAVLVRPPEGRDLRGNDTRFTVSEPTNVTVVLQRSVELNATFLEADGDPAVNHTIALFGEGERPGSARFGRTADDGSLTLPVDPDATYDVQYYQATFVAPGEVTADSFPRDGSVDLYAVDRISTESDVDLGTIQVPEGHVLNVTVEDPNGTPIEGALVRIDHLSADGPADAGLANLTTNADGQLEIDGPAHSLPGIEVTGSVHVAARPPPDATEFADGPVERNVTVTDDTGVTLVLDQATTVSAQFVEADGDPAANDSIALFGEGPDPGEARFGRTAADGSIDLAVDDNATYDVQYYQANFIGPAETAPGAFPRDGSPDLFAVERVRTDGSVDLGTVSLPTASVLNVTVVDAAGEPIEGARVRIDHRPNGTPADAGLANLTTNANGRLELESTAHGLPGIEVNGPVGVTVIAPPDGSGADETVVRNLTVTNDTSIEVTLETSTGPPPVVGDVPPTDPDGDGAYEDINGDGSVNVIDVQGLFVNLNSDAVQNNPSAFDFNGDGTVNIIDVQALFIEAV